MSVPSPIVGVVTVPARAVHFDIQQQVATMLQGVAPGRTMAVLNIPTSKGINIAVAHKFNDHWSTALWIGKSGWDAPPEGALTVAFSR